MENKNIQELLEIIKSLGCTYELSEDFFGAEKEIIIDIHIPLPQNESYVVFVSVSENADAKEISDQLYLLADDFDADVKVDMEEEDYTDEQIHEVKTTCVSLYKSHLFAINRTLKEE